jgi:arylsulfatase A-like enzyme
MKLPSLSPLLAALASFTASAMAKPNIVVFLVDDLGVMDTSVSFLTDSSGNPQQHALNNYYHTPAMERLAAGDIRFNNFCAMSVCSPSRVSLLTGQNAARHRTTFWIDPNKNNGGTHGPPAWRWEGLNERDVTLPRLLQAAGYRTLHVGKGHLGPKETPGADPRHLGFDRNVAGSYIGDPGSYYGSDNYGGSLKKPRNPVPHLEKYHGTDTFLSEALTLEAKALVTEAVEAKEPFLLHLAHYAVHSPFYSDPRFAGRYRESVRPPKAQALATLAEGMDTSLGDLLDHLDTLGVAENTLVVFLGDNGSDAPLGDPHAIACAAPLRGRKGTHYEGGMRVPFIAVWARPAADHPEQRRLPIAAGSIQNQQAAIHDIFPTLLALAGADTPPGHIVDGARLDTLFTGKPDPAREEAFLMHCPHGRHNSAYFTTYREGSWKVIYHYFPSAASGGSHYQLFDLGGDPSESTNLAQSHPIELRRMMERLIASLERHEALYPVIDDVPAAQARLSVTRFGPPTLKSRLSTGYQRRLHSSAFKLQRLSPA